MSVLEIVLLCLFILLVFLFLFRNKLSLVLNDVKGSIINKYYSKGNYLDKVDIREHKDFILLATQYAICESIHVADPRNKRSPKYSFINRVAYIPINDLNVLKFENSYMSSIRKFYISYNSDLLGIDLKKGFTYIASPGNDGKYEIDLTLAQRCKTAPNSILKYGHISISFYADIEQRQLIGYYHIYLTTATEDNQLCG